MILKSCGDVYLLTYLSFRDKAGSDVPGVCLFDPESRQTINLYGPATLCVPRDLDSMTALTVSFEWSFSKQRGWRPRLIHASL